MTSSREELLREAEEHLGFLSNLPGVHPHRIARIREALIAPAQQTAHPHQGTKFLSGWMTDQHARNATPSTGLPAPAPDAEVAAIPPERLAIVIAQAIADDLLKSPKDGGNHGCLIPHSAQLDGFIIRGHVDLYSLADAVLEALAASSLSSTKALAQSVWQPIETAPKDGSYVLISSHQYVDVVRWSHGSFGGFNRDDELRWMPLPIAYGVSPPPSTQSGDGK